LRQAHSNEIKDLKKERKDLFKDAKKLIDLSNKVLIFLDTPSAKLFEVLMPLLSHDKYEAEYEFTDIHNGIKTKTNILRGFPAVIFTAAIDYSHTHRYSEIQRRFIIANPKMTSEKYSSAIHHIAHQLALPDFVYQKLIVSDAQKEKARSIIQQIQERLSEITKQNRPGQNSVLIPFYESIQGSTRKLSI
jgi:hypothetical protein